MHKQCCHQQYSIAIGWDLKMPWCLNTQLFCYGGVCTVYVCACVCMCMFVSVGDGCACVCVCVCVHVCGSVDICVS